MIENEKQYLVTQDRERQFAQLVERMENGDDDRTPGEHPIIRQAKLDSTRSILQELREKSKHGNPEPAPRPTHDNQRDGQPDNSYQRNC